MQFTHYVDLPSLQRLKFVDMFQVGGDPSPVIRWSRQGRDGLPPGVQILSERGLSVTSVHPGDQGLYVCSASNKAGSVTASAMLRVQVGKYSFLIIVTLAWLKLLIIEDVSWCIDG